MGHRAHRSKPQQNRVQCGTLLEMVKAVIRFYANTRGMKFARCVMRLDEGDLSGTAHAEVRAYK